MNPHTVSENNYEHLIRNSDQTRFNHSLFCIMLVIPTLLSKITIQRDLNVFKSCKINGPTYSNLVNGMSYNLQYVLSSSLKAIEEDITSRIHKTFNNVSSFIKHLYIINDVHQQRATVFVFRKVERQEI